MGICGPPQIFLQTLITVKVTILGKHQEIRKHLLRSIYKENELEQLGHLTNRDLPNMNKEKLNQKFSMKHKSIKKALLLSSKQT